MVGSTGVVGSTGAVACTSQPALRTTSPQVAAPEHAPKGLLRTAMQAWHPARPCRHGTPEPAARAHRPSAACPPAVCPQVDPTLTRADRLVGNVLGQVGALPDVYSELEINFFLLRRWVVQHAHADGARDVMMVV